MSRLQHGPVVTRRVVWTGAAAAFAALAATGAAQVAREGPVARAMTPPEANEAARDGRVLLIDVRRPEEWVATGIPDGAVALDMREPAFASALSESDGRRPLTAGGADLRGRGPVRAGGGATGRGGDRQRDRRARGDAGVGCGCGLAGRRVAGVSPLRSD